SRSGAAQPTGGARARQDRMNGGGDTETLQRGDRAPVLRLLEDQADLAPETVRRDPVERAARDRGDEGSTGRRLEAETEAGGVGNGPEDAGRIVDEGAGVQNAYEPAAQVVAASERVEQTRPPHDRECHGADREVTAREVLLNRNARRDVGQGAA